MDKESKQTSNAVNRQKTFQVYILLHFTHRFSITN